MPISLSTTGDKITPCLWFDDRIEEAVNFYVSVFANSRITQVSRWPKGSPQADAWLTAQFELESTPFMALNGGPQYQFSPAISFSVRCETQEEIDALWAALLAGGGQESRCGWLSDRFGLSWQIVPSALPRLLTAKDEASRARVMQAFMQMSKFDIAALEKAAQG